MIMAIKIRNYLLKKKKQEAKEVRAQARHDAVNDRITAEQFMNAQREAQHRQAKINR